MGTDLLENNYAQIIADLAERVRRLESKETSVKEMSSLSSDMGLFEAGEIRVHADPADPHEPGDGFSGVRIVDRFEYPEDSGNYYAIVGANNDSPTFLISAIDGTGKFANLHATLGANGIDIDEFLNYAIRHTFTNDSKTRVGKLGPDIMTGSTTPVWTLAYATPAAAEMMVNGDLETADFSNWTKTTETNGAWVIDDVIYKNGAYSAKWTPTRFGYGGVKSLLHFDGADASTTFTDVSGKTWTKYNHAQIDTAQSVFGGASGLFDGTDDYIDTPDHADFAVGSGDFEFEFRVRPSALQNNTILGQNKSDLSFANTSFRIGLYDTGEIWAAINSGGTGYVVTSGINVYAANTWYTVSFSRYNNILYLRIDGVAYDTLDVTGITVNNSAYKMAIGRSGEYNGSYFNGWIDEFYFSKGVAIHTADYTPEIAAWVDIKTEGVLTSDRVVVTGSTAYLISSQIRGTVKAGTIKAEVKWYDHASAGSLISTDLIGNLLAAGDFEQREIIPTSPSTALSCVIVLTCSSSTTSEINFDDISISLSSVNQKLWLSDTGVGLTNSLSVAGALDWGTYTPTLTNTANVSASTARLCQYMRVGNVVTVSGVFDVDPSSSSTLTKVGMSLPVASDFTSGYEMGGTATRASTDTLNGTITADTVNDRALIQWYTGGSVVNQTFVFHFTYLIV